MRQAGVIGGGSAMGTHGTGTHHTTGRCCTSGQGGYHIHTESCAATLAACRAAKLALVPGLRVQYFTRAGPH
jgi:hypothetical protein